jgi:hypothetical protein
MSEVRDSLVVSYSLRIALRTMGVEASLRNIEELCITEVDDSQPQIKAFSVSPDRT